MDKNLIGAHVSAAGGICKAIERAQELGVSVFQTFGSSPKQYQVAELKEEDIATFKKARKEAGITHIFLHGPYLVNLASSTPAVRHSSRTALAGHLRIAQQLGVDGVIFHVGSVGKGNGK
ncbi:MAG: TIM barrel protein, partial [Candidatus Spechtbacterales bacterium]